MQERKRRKINIEWKDLRTLRYFIFSTVIGSIELHARMFLDRMSSVFRSFTYYIQVRRTKKKTFRQRNLGKDILDYFH
jgi:hypothetical protein